MFLRIITLYVILCSKCDCANILGIIPTASFSHQVAFMNVWKQLSLKGHHVTVLTTDPRNDPSLSNLTEIDLSVGYKFIEEKHNWSQTTNEVNPLSYLKIMLQMLYEATDLYLSLPDVQNLIHNKSLHFDVVMVEGIFPEWLIFGEVFNAPTIMLTSLDATVQIHRAFQNPAHPILYPESYIPYVGELSFKERVIATVLNWTFNYIKSSYYITRKKNIEKYFGDSSISIPELIEKSSMLFISVSPVLLLPRPLTSRTIVIGGGTTINNPKKLPEDIQQFLDSADEGAIFFSLGTNAKSENLGDDTIKDLVNMFKKLPYKVLWKFSNKDGYELPDNVKIVDWVPQQDVLRHTNLKLFVTQGGIQSLEEAVFFEIPIVGIPIFGDQESNVKRLESKGILKMVQPKPKLNTVKLQEAIFKVITNETYKENIKMLKDLNMNQPISGIDKAVWWTEYVVRYRGKVNHLIHEAARTIPFYQYYLLDVLAFLGVLLLFAAVFIYAISKFLMLHLFKFINRKYLSNKKDA